MNHQNIFTRQCVHSRSHNDNSSTRYSAPSANFKEILAGYANQNCSRCGGTGYIGMFKHVCCGRCFKCMPEPIFEQAKEEFNQRCKTGASCDEMAEIYQAVCGDNWTMPAYLSGGVWITPDGQIGGISGLGSQSDTTTQLIQYPNIN